MSRYYRLELEIFPCPSEKKRRAMKKALSEEITIEGTSTNGVLYIWGAMSMSGGASPSDIHSKLKKLLCEIAPVKLKSRWLCMDYVEWHEELGDDFDE